MEQLAAIVLGGAEPCRRSVDGHPSLAIAAATALFGLVIVVAVVVLALAAPLIAPFSPDDQMFDGLTLKARPSPPGGQFFCSARIRSAAISSRACCSARARR